MEDLANPNNPNPLSDILPPIFHRKFSRKFLDLKVEEFAKNIVEPNFKEDFKEDLIKLNDVFRAIKIFVSIECPLGWCPDGDEGRIKSALDKLK